MFDILQRFKWPQAKNVRLNIGTLEALILNEQRSKERSVPGLLMGMLWPLKAPTPL